MPNIKRLRTMLAFMKALPSKSFNIKHWVEIDDVDDIDTAHECGTTACILGWACLIPEFRKDGLGLTKADPMYKDGYPIFNDHYGAMAGASFFEISIDDAYDLFNPSNYTDRELATKEDAIAKIELLLRSMEPATDENDPPDYLSINKEISSS